jgi:non-ribosomal peptide synthetase component F
MSANHETLPPLTTDASIPVRIRQVARHAPDHLAIVDGERRITYAGLDAWSERIAQTIASAVGDQPQPIALHFGQGIPVIAAMLGVLKAGHFYTVLDTAMPENRVRAVLDNLRSGYLLTAEASDLHYSGMQVVMCPGQPEQTLETGTLAMPSPDALAAIYYTSGTTGQPKGVMVEHAMLVTRASQINESVPVTPHDVVANLFSPAYSAAAADIYGALLNGATLAHYRPAQLRAGELRDWLIVSRVTLLHLHSGILSQLLDVLPADFHFEHLRYVHPSGRTRVDEVRRLRRHLPRNAIVMHQLTSSETAAVLRLTIRGDTELEGEILPVGYPLDPEQVTLVGPDGQDFPL